MRMLAKGVAKAQMSWSWISRGGRTSLIWEFIQVFLILEFENDFLELKFDKDSF